MEEKLEETLRKLAAGQERLENRTEDLGASVGELTRVVRELTGVVRELAERQANTDRMLGELTGAVRELAERQADTDRMIGELTRVVRELSEHVARTDMRPERIDGRLEKIDKRLEDVHLVATLISIDQRASNSKLDLVAKAIEEIDDVVLESKAKDQLPFSLKEDILDLKVLDKDFVCHIISAAEDKGVLTKAESNDVGKADIFAFGFDKKTGDLVCLAVEVSATIGKNDITMADRRSKLFAKAVRHFVENEPDKWEKMRKMVYPNHH
ncbi:hypothetical protein [Candidatus Methylacidiphilum infernorum]|nr:hypothetical protein [Candidatus Methylacidiphilum infernorum]